MCWHLQDQGEHSFQPLPKDFRIRPITSFNNLRVGSAGLCTGEYGVGRATKKRLSYEGCSFFRSVKDLSISKAFMPTRV